MSRKLSIFSLILSVIIFTSCSKVEDLENRTAQMDKNTEEMNQTTKQMALITEKLFELTSLIQGTTIGMNATMDNMMGIMNHINSTADEMNEVITDADELIDYAHPQLRSKESEDTRAKKMSVILSENAGLGQKVVSSVIYMQAFEYQYWINNGTYDDNDIRDYLIYDAVNELFGRTLDIWQAADLKKITPLKDNPKKYNNEMALMALGYSLHFNHYVQTLLHKNKGNFEVLSMYDIIANALKREKAGEELKPYEDLILAGMNKEIAIELLQSRIKMATGMAINYGATNDKTMKGFTKVGAGLFIASKGKAGKIKLYSKFEKGSKSTQRYVLQQLEMANSTVELLKAIGKKPTLGKDLSSIMINLQTDRSKRFKKDASIQRYYFLIDSLRKVK